MVSNSRAGCAYLAQSVLSFYSVRNEFARANTYDVRRRFSHEECEKSHKETNNNKRNKTKQNKTQTKETKEPNAVHEGSCTLAITSCVHYLAITVT
ncbi:hypothetical protein HOL82_03540 [Candidatus Woesearchaeota archaeon]|nr:hypothetical protein [Candidatus Woesearchaeota archaeon]